VKSSLAVVGNKSIDVIIPQLVANSIYILQDLAQQTHLPVNVIIVEQTRRR
jgi:hypothetical protein